MEIIIIELKNEDDFFIYKKDGPAIIYYNGFKYWYNHARR